MTYRLVLLLLMLGLITACSRTPQHRKMPQKSGPSDIKAALDSVNSEDLLRHTRVLASDEYEGRAPGTRGEELTVKYLTEQFQKLGLKPGNPDGSYVQKVPLAGFTPESEASFVSGRSDAQSQATDRLCGSLQALRSRGESREF